MIVTINTDASFWRDYKRGSFAFWAVCDQGKICKSGMLKAEIHRPEVAEFMCIINAITALLNSEITGITRIIINTDCLNVIHIMENRRKEMQKYGLTVWGVPLRKRFESIRPKGVIIEFRHVKAHEQISTSKQWVNDWCDQEAKRVLRDWVLKQKLEDGNKS